ncbi:tigger transposable element-derived protein 4-like [Ornithodoros turicata]|uniref:tigger transposable element-derived protein 4-like n=1 Tax=Ornithodoros turicata TaxID=34597 RepID=UPI003139A3BB
MDEQQREAQVVVVAETGSVVSGNDEIRLMQLRLTVAEVEIGRQQLVVETQRVLAKSRCVPMWFEEIEATLEVYNVPQRVESRESALPVGSGGIAGADPWRHRLPIALTVESFFNDLRGGRDSSVVPRGLYEDTVDRFEVEWIRIVLTRTIEEAYEAEAFGSERKRLRTAKHPDLERALLTWIKDVRSRDIPLSGPIIMAKATDFALRLNHADFAASEGWFQRFRERHNLVFRTISGEAKEVNKETCSTWQRGQLQDYLARYSPHDVFNADETALLFKLLPEKTITYKGDDCAGGKRSKERVTVLLGANMSGTEKLPLFVIGKSSKPRCFKNIRTLPTEYTSNSKAWMTGELFKWWRKKLDRKFELQKRRVLLIVDNCSAHKVDVELKSIELAFLPANTTAALQPMDQGIIKNVKSFYRRHILERMILCPGSYTVNLLSAMHMLARAWEQVTAATISNCFRHCGFVVADTEASDSAAAPEVTCENVSDVRRSMM